MTRILSLASALTLALTTPLAARAAEVVMAVGRVVPPYVIAEERRGLEYDVVREALALEGHTLTPKFVSFARAVRELQAGMVDATMTMRPDSGVTAFYSASHVSYRNVVITLASRDIAIKRPEDLAGKSVLAFQNASQYLGPAFKAMADANPRYREEARQVVQPLQLFLGRVDAVVTDRFIFGWFANDPEVRAKADIGQTLRIHPLFAATEYHVAFHDAALRDSFNRGLRKLRDTGTYDRIVERYSTYLKEEGGG